MRLGPAFFTIITYIVTITSFAILLIVCSKRAHDKGSAYTLVETYGKELTKLQLTRKENDRRLVIAQLKVKEAEELFEDCQKNNKQTLRDIDNVREESREHQRRVYELEQNIQKHDSAIIGVELSVKSIKFRNGNDDCKPTWSSEADTNSVGGILHEISNTLDDCLAYCLGLPACVVVDYNAADIPKKRCWFHTSPVGVGPRDTFSQPGTTQYRLKRTCDTDKVGQSESQKQNNQEIGVPIRNDQGAVNEQGNQDLQAQRAAYPVLNVPNNPQVVDQQDKRIQRLQNTQLEVAVKQNQLGIGDEGGRVVGQEGQRDVSRGGQQGFVVEQGQGVVGQQGQQGGIQQGQQDVNSPVQRGWYAPIIHQQGQQVQQGQVQQGQFQQKQIQQGQFQQKQVQQGHVQQVLGQ